MSNDDHSNPGATAGTATALPYATSSERPPASPFFKQCARASFVAPILAIVIGILTSTSRLEAERAGEKPSNFIGYFNLGLVGIGLILGLIALMGFLTKRGRGTLGYIIVGFLFNGAIATAFLSMVLSARNHAIAARPVPQNAQSDAALEKQGQDSYLNSTGWAGAFNSPRMIVAISQVDSHNPIVQEMLATLPQPCNVFSIAIRSSPQNAKMEVYPEQAMLQLSDGTYMPVLNAQIIAAAVKDQAAIKRAAGTRTIEPGQDVMNLMLFISPDITAERVRSIKLPCSDPSSISIPGRVYTPAEKQEMLKRAAGQGAR